MIPNNTNVKDRLKELRGELTQAAFAEKFGVVAVTISQIEKGKQNPSWDLALRICEEFNCSMDWLQGRSETKQIQAFAPDAFKDKYYDLLEKSNALKDKIIQLQDELLVINLNKNFSKIEVK
ncbi:MULTISPECIES: helix-turn-helix domain-containing protein [Emticicia]|uniref:helix-turn-helix domain-containing protein n=1 Tax=Emticicia TaxID=312278 RepID=UPI0007D8C465|nr:MULTISPECIES: helix-turn-helix transcriptional regulator [Emticicia]